jgi:hypothetical protein
MMGQEEQENQGVEELIMGEEVAIPEESVPQEEMYAPTSEEAYAEAIHVPVENLGQGIINALGDMVGGMVGLKGTAEESLKKSVDFVKEKISPSEKDEEALAAEALEAEEVEEEVPFIKE